MGEPAQAGTGTEAQAGRAPETRRKTRRRPRAAEPSSAGPVFDTATCVELGAIQTGMAGIAQDIERTNPHRMPISFPCKQEWMQRLRRLENRLGTLLQGRGEAGANG